MTTTFRMFLSDDAVDFDDAKMAVFGCCIHTLEDGTRIAYSDIDIEDLLTAFLNKQAILLIVQDTNILPN
jgi:hypothetical protein